MFDAEALLLVEDEKPEVAELHVFGKKAVGADEKVHFPLFKGSQNFRLLLFAAEAVEAGDAHAEILHPRFGGAEVLFAQNGARAHEGRLPPVEDAEIGCPERHFRLAEADVAAEEAVHHLIRTHVRLDLGDG